MPTKPPTSIMDLLLSVAYFDKLDEIVEEEILDLSDTSRADIGPLAFSRTCRIIIRLVPIFRTFGGSRFGPVLWRTVYSLSSFFIRGHFPLWKPFLAR